MIWSALKTNVVKMKGQASLEMLVTVAIVVAFTIPVVLLLLTVAQYGYEDTTLSQADAAARMFADNINDVYWQGENAKRRIAISLPTNTDEVTVSRNEVVIKLETSTGEYEAISPVFAEVNDFNVTDRGGLVILYLEVQQDGKVDIYGEGEE